MIGAGAACAEKLKSLSELGRGITVIAPRFHPSFLEQNWIRRIPRHYRQGDLKGFDLAYVGIDDASAEEEILQEAREEGCLVNFVNRVPLSDFISPSALIRRHFALFISTFGRGPGAVKKIRRLLEEKLDLETLDRETGEYIRKREERKKGEADEVGKESEENSNRQE